MNKPILKNKPPKAWELIDNEETPIKPENATDHKTETIEKILNIVQFEKKDKDALVRDIGQNFFEKQPLSRFQKFLESFKMPEYSPPQFYQQVWNWIQTGQVYTNPRNTLTLEGFQDTKIEQTWIYLPNQPNERTGSLKREVSAEQLGIKKYSIVQELKKPGCHSYVIDLTLADDCEQSFMDIFLEPYFKKWGFEKTEELTYRKTNTFFAGKIIGLETDIEKSELKHFDHLHCATRTNFASGYAIDKLFHTGILDELYMYTFHPLIKKTNEKNVS